MSKKVFLGNDGKWYAIPMEGHNFHSGMVNVDYGQCCSDAHYFNARLHRCMHKALGEFKPTHWESLDLGALPGLPEGNCYDMQEEGAVSKDLIRHALMIADKTQSYFNRQCSSRIRACLMSVGGRHELRSWVQEVEGIPSAESTQSGVESLWSNQMQIITDMAPFCHSPGDLWVILDGPVATAQLNHDGDDWSVWSVRIPEEYRHSFFRIRYK